ncbi:DUF485 domain-containing protein [Streptomyces sp. NBC_01476]|uniref:DUF485 domain-containing protein n=1 Tax=Streptomyces sp. NBC_01476 TaxID=2903881 RepID=UPI002E345048|nr:DUF485 domain-containing protein [Streptomyces sp. NBC_01476]
MDKHDGGDPTVLRVDDPWQNAGAAGLWVPDQQAPETPGWTEQVEPGGGEGPQTDGAGTEYAEPVVGADRAAVYLEVQGSAEFRAVRDRYRKFVFPAVVGFVAWYLLYVVLATTAPGLMAHPVAGELNVALVAGLAQFASTFALTWAYARHARLRRDRAALDLRWTLATRTGQERVR